MDNARYQRCRVVMVPNTVSNKARKEMEVAERISHKLFRFNPNGQNCYDLAQTLSLASHW